MIELELPYPPTVNHYWIWIGKGLAITKKGKAFREIVIAECMQRNVKQIEGRVRLDIYVYPPDRRKRDIDNVLKPLIDALEHAGVYENDSQIDDIRIRRGTITEDGATLIRIEEIG